MLLAQLSQDGSQHLLVSDSYWRKRRSANFPPDPEDVRRRNGPGPGEALIIKPASCEAGRDLMREFK